MKKIANQIIECFKRGSKLMIIGNGGSAAQAQHLAAELVGKYLHDRKALPAIALTTDTSILTAWSNDYEFESVFERQIEALGKKFDVLLVISTSGTSINCTRAIARAMGMKIFIIDLPRKGKDTPTIQEFQLKCIHKICEIVERAFL